MFCYKHQRYREESDTRWREGIREVAEDSDEGEADINVDYISSDESAHMPDLGDRLRVKSRDIWDLGMFYIITFDRYKLRISLVYIILNRELCIKTIAILLEEIQETLRLLQSADEISSLIETAHCEDVVSYALEMDEGGVRCAMLWACWMGKTCLLSKLLKIGGDPNSRDDAGRSVKTF